MKELFAYFRSPYYRVSMIISKFYFDRLRTLVSTLEQDLTTFDYSVNSNLFFAVQAVSIFNTNAMLTGFLLLYTWACSLEKNATTASRKETPATPKIVSSE